MTNLHPTPARVIVLAVIPAATTSVLTGWAAASSVRFAIRLIRKR